MAKKIEVAIVGDASNFVRSLNSAESGTSKFSGTLGKLKVAAIGAAAGGVAVLGKFLVDSVKAAIGAQQSQARLEQAFKNVGLSAIVYKDQVEQAEAASRKLGFTDEDVKDSLGSLLSATRNVSAATRDMAVAQDLARFKHIDLEQATKMLTMAMTGSQRAVKQLGITVIPVTKNVDALKRSHMDLSTESGRAALKHAQLLDKMATGQEVIQKTSDLVKGQGEAFAGTAAGGMAQFHAQLQHLEVLIGTALLPILTHLIDKATEIATFLSLNLGPSVIQVKDALGHLGFAARILGEYLRIEFKAIMLLWRTEFFLAKEAIHGAAAALSGLRSAASVVADFFIGIFHGAVTAVHTVVSAFRTTVDAVVDAFRASRNAGVALANWFKGAGTAAFQAFQGVAAAIRDVIRAIADALHAAVGGAKALADALGNIHMPSLHLPSIKLPHIPGFQAGGIVPGAIGAPMLATVHGGEMVIPTGRGFTRSAPSINLYVAGSVVSERDLIRSIRDALVQEGRRTGGNLLGGYG